MGEVVRFPGTADRGLLEVAGLVEIGLERYLAACSEGERESAARFAVQAAIGLLVLQSGKAEARATIERTLANWDAALDLGQGRA